MESSIAKEILDAAETSLIDSSHASEQEFRVRLVSNNCQKKENMLSEINRHLMECHYYDFSVAFITLSRVEMLLQTFKELENRNVKGRILTTDFLTFTEPKAL